MIDREKIIRAARARYITTGVTNNITAALRMYLECDVGPDERTPLFITSPELRQIAQAMQLIRPKCDECGANLMLQITAVDPSGQKHPTAWVCTKCNVVYYSELTPAEWLTEIRDETRKQKLQHTDKP